MKILHTVEFYTPSVGGMQEVVKQLSERLVAAGHDVTVATTALPNRTEKVINGVKIQEFTISGNDVRGYTGSPETYQKYLLESDFDVVTNFAAQQWATDLALPLLDKIKARKIFVPTGFSGLYLPEYKEYFAQMPEWLDKYDMNVFLSDNYRDINFAREHKIKQCMLIPNGAAADEFLAPVTLDIHQRLGISKDTQLILHVGSHTGVKGHHEAIEIFKRAKLKNATLVIVANDLGGGCTRRCALEKTLFSLSLPQRQAGKRVVITSLTREETLAAYHAADLFLFPSNIECSPLVLFECMASKTPFLTTDVGNAKEIISWCGSGEILPTTTDANGYSYADIPTSATQLEALLADTPKREKMAEHAFKVWQEKFSWEKITEEYAKLYQGGAKK
jgi:glycosyltransferase involved in cell wall biosynthesis